MLLMLKDDGNGGSSLRAGGEGLRMDSEGLGAVAGIYRVISCDVMELRCTLTVSVDRSQLNFNFPDATNFYRNRLGTSVARCGGAGGGTMHRYVYIYLCSER